MKKICLYFCHNWNMISIAQSKEMTGIEEGIHFLALSPYRSAHLCTAKMNLHISTTVISIKMCNDINFLLSFLHPYSCPCSNSIYQNNGDAFLDHFIKI